MKQIKKALLDSVIFGGLMMITAVLINVPIYKVLIPISGIAIYNFGKASFILYKEKKGNEI